MRASEFARSSGRDDSDHEVAKKHFWDWQESAWPYVVTVLGAIVALEALFGSWFVVPPANVAFTRWLGGTVMESQPLAAGLHLKVPMMESVDEIQVSQSMYTLPEMYVYTNDNQEVGVYVSVIYSIPLASVRHLLYDVGRAGAVDVDATVLPVVRNDAQAIFARYNTLTISDKRQAIADAMQAQITTDLERLFGINVINVQLTGIAYTDAFTQAVEAAMSAKAAATQAENLVNQKKFQAEQVVATAQGNAQQAVILAKANAEARVAAAEGEAKAIALVSDALRQNPAYTRWYEASKWDGALPRYVSGNAVNALPMVDADK